MKTIVSFIGFSGSGKDYESNLLIMNHNFKRIGFSDGVREATFNKYNTFPQYGKEYDKWKQSVILEQNGVPKTGRDLLIEVGEGMRKIDPFIWSNTWYNTIIMQQPENVVVNDCRFIHEADAIINIANRLEYKFEFVFCNYKSKRFVKTNNSTDEFASYFANCKHLENITDLVINLHSNAILERY